MKLLHDLTKDLVQFRDQRLLLALSGGLDSMALLHIGLHFRENFGINIAATYFHHGPADDPIQLDYRFNAYEFVRTTCLQNQVPFFSNYGGGAPDEFLLSFSGKSHSEAEYRKRRYRYLIDLLEKQAFDRLVLAHHADDLLETRLIRLIRGVGPEGLQAMTEDSGQLLRPLLKQTRKDLKHYLVERGASWLEDPSNNEERPLRNWLRKKWLTDLETKHPGARQSLARSLDLLTGMVSTQNSHDQCFDGSRLDLSEFLCLNLGERKQVIATYMKRQGLKNYGLSHIHEVLKRLDTEKKNLTFRLLGHNWTVDAGRLSVERLG